jgi:hypothetical protein
METESFPPYFWEFNYPVSLVRRDDGSVEFVAYSPRKLRCYEGDEPAPADEVEQFIDNSILKMQRAIELFEEFKRGEIDEFRYWE